MTGQQRLAELGLNSVKASYYLELPVELIAEAAAEEEIPTWLDICLTAMEETAEEDDDAFTYLQVGQDIQGTSWSEVTARQAVPIIIEYARRGETLTYQDLDRELRERDPSRKNAGTLPKYAKPLGLVGNVIDQIRKEATLKDGAVSSDYARIPPLEVIVTRGRTGMPGTGADGFLISYLEDIGQKNVEDRLHFERKALYLQAQKDVMDYDKWGLLLGLCKK
ncbi:hypothetical protein [Paracoccus sp. T5]|uniref:hypothetical protein n=1 Tax=Paracoccus sp. T5 TaxID=3402161 RepID=UPI003AE4916D